MSLYKKRLKKCCRNNNSLIWKKINEAKKAHLPVTQSFIGVLAGTQFDESEYKKHLEDKYR